MTDKNIPENCNKSKNLNVVTIIIISLIFIGALFFIIYPVIISGDSVNENIGIGAGSNLSKIEIKVSIPCSGHAPLIIGELKKANGVEDVSFEMPNIFEISYDSSITSKDKIFGAEIFKSFPAMEVKNS